MKRVIGAARLAFARVLFRDESIARIEAADPAEIDRASFKRTLREIDSLPA